MSAIETTETVAIATTVETTEPRERTATDPAVAEARARRSARAADASARRAQASIAFGRERGYYRLLFDAGSVDVETFAELADIPERMAAGWLAEQVEAGILRVVTGPSGRAELLLPGELVPDLLREDVEPRDPRP